MHQSAPSVYLRLAMSISTGRLKGLLLVVLGIGLVISLGTVPAKAQCMLSGWMGGGYCYDWGNMFSGRTVRIYPSGGREVRAQTPFGVMQGVWVAPGDAVLDAGNQLICCYGRNSTGLQYGFCRLCE